LIKYVYFLLFSASLFAQDIKIPTKFLEEGSLYSDLDKSSNQLSNPVVAFGIGDKCVVIGFLGRDNYKVQYKEWEGIVKDMDLLVNEKMSDLYFDFQEKERAKAIELEQIRKREMQEVIKYGKVLSDEKRQQITRDSIAKVNAENLKQARISDSIAQVKLIEKNRLEAMRAEALKKAELMKSKRLADSVAQVQALEKLRLDNLKAQELKLLEAQKAQRVKDSIAEIAAIESKRLEKERALTLKKEAELEKQRVKDSTAKAKLEDKKRLEFEKEQAKAAEAKIKKEKDALAKAEEIEKKRLKFEQEQAKIRKEAEALEAKRLRDSTAKANEVLRKQKEAEDKRLEIERAKIAELNRLAEQNRLARKEEKRVSDSITKAEELNRLKVKREQEKLKLEQEAELEFNRINDSITRAKVARALILKDEKQKALEAAEKRQELLEQKKELEQEAGVAKLEGNAVTAINRVNQPEDGMLSQNENLERMEFRNKCHFVLDEYDDYARKATIKTESYDVSKNIGVELFRYGYRASVFINSSLDLGCVSYLPNNRSKVIIRLENNKVVTLYHSWNMDCGEFLFKADLSSAKIASLKKSPIKSIKLIGTKGSKEIENIKYKEIFMDKLKCVE
jgi:hypothetical protein